MLNRIGLASFLWDKGKWNKYKHWQIYTSVGEKRAGGGGGSAIDYLQFCCFCSEEPPSSCCLRKAVSFYHDTLCASYITIFISLQPVIRNMHS